MYLNDLAILTARYIGPQLGANTNTGIYNAFHILAGSGKVQFAALSFEYSTQILNFNMLIYNNGSFTLYDRNSYKFNAPRQHSIYYEIFRY